MFKKAERWGIALVGLTMVVSLAVALIAGGKSLAHHLNNLPYGALTWLLLATVVESILRFWRYHVAGQALHLKVPLSRMAFYYTVGYALLPTPGKVGTAIRLWLIKQNHNVPYRRSAPLLVMDLASDTLAMCALATISLAILDDPRLQTLGWLVGLALAGGAIAALTAPTYLRRVIKLLYFICGKRKPRLFARLLLLLHTARHILGFKTLLTTTMLSFSGWGLVGIACAYLVTQLGHPITAAAGTLAVTLSTMGGFITMMPAGVGGAEVTMAGIFTLFNVPLVEAVLATVLIRLIILWLTVALGLALLPIALRNIRRR